MLSLAFSPLRQSFAKLISSKTLTRTAAMTLVFAGIFSVQGHAQSSVKGGFSSTAGLRAPIDRLTQPIQESNRLTLQGTMHPLATKANDRGAVSDGMKLDRLQVVLKRSDVQEKALKQLIGDMHAPGSANYHKWLTPEDFGKQFGPSDADVAKLQSWLGSHGFSITKMNPGRQTLEISGTAGQFRDAFHAEIHTFQVKGETHFANASDPQIPVAVAPVFGGFASLNNFRLKSQAHVLGKAQFNRVTHEATPDWTYLNANNLIFAPGDLAVQYDLNPLYAAGTDGSGQSIAIVNDSNINIAQVNNYRKLFNLPVNPPQVIIDGNDPGIDAINSLYGKNGDSFEAYLDVELAGAVAPNAQINLVVADSTALQSGLTLAIERAVYSNISPVLSLSFGGCELGQGSFNNFISSLWEQAAAQGITVLVSSGDAGSAACDNDNTQNFAVRGQAVNGLASTPYNVAVGGTDLYYRGGSADLPTYWNLTPSNATPTVSLKTKVPEQPFNTSQYGLNLNDYYANSGNTSTSIFAAGGGASTCGLSTLDAQGNTTACAPYPKPVWQTGAGVPNDQVRDLPDVSMFGALDSSKSITPICSSDGDCEGGATVQISGVGGTSVSAPGFAGIMALVTQKYGRQGQANYILYPLAKQFPASFNDVVAGNNSVPCATGTAADIATGVSYPQKNCQTVTGGLVITDNVYGTTTEGEIGFAPGVPAYSAGIGYDLASGLGSVDANELVKNWGSVTIAASSTSLATSSTSFTHGTTVAISGTVTGSSPTGDVSLLATSVDPGQQGQLFFPLSAGSYSGNVNTLPGGTYDISSYYSGDGSNGPSTSAPITVTVAPEASKTLLQVFSVPNAQSSLAPIASGGTYTYGTALILSAQPTNSAGTVSTLPTGNVIFSDSSTTLNTAVLNAEGDAEYNGTLPPGSHSITAAYSGDGSYGKSTSSPVTFTVAKETPAISAINYEVSQGQNIVNADGSLFTVLVENTASFTGLPIAAPSGTLSLTGAPGGTTASATLTPGFDPNTGAPAGIALFQVPGGAATSNYTFNFSYAGDANYTTATQSIPETLGSFQGGIISTTTASVSAGATSPAAKVLVTVTVAGPSGNPAPTGTLFLISNGNSMSAVGGANLPTGTGSSATVTIAVDSASLYQGINQITVLYQGDNTYYPSESTVTIANSLSDFSMLPITTIVNVPGTGSSAGAQTDVLNLTSYNGFSGSVALTCAGSGGVTCSLNPASASLSSNGTVPVTLSVDTTAITTAGTYSVIVTGTDSTGNYIHTIGLQVVSPVPVVTPGFRLAGNAVAISTQGGTGTSTITATSVGGFTGTAALTCAITATPTGAANIPTCSLSPATVTLSGTAATSTLTVNTTAQTTSRLEIPLKGIFTAGGSVALAALFFFGFPVGRRSRRAIQSIRAVRILSVAMLFALIASAGVGCGSSSSSGGNGGSGGGGGGTPTGGTTTGIYTVTVTGTPSSGTAQTVAVTVTVN